MTDVHIYIKYVIQTSVTINKSNVDVYNIPTKYTSL